jgi:predicted Ser/Thr protein kinase
LDGLLPSRRNASVKDEKADERLNMDTIRICQECGQPLPENAPEGLCPACLAKVALGSEPAAPDATIMVNPLPDAAPGTRVPPSVAELAPQFPQLEILELLGMGGMGMVYKARQPRVDRLVALKILPVDSARGASFAERFQREAKALAKLNHPGIVTFYDFGQTSQYYYFIMEYVDGMNLRQLLKAKSLEPRQALELVTQICTALQYAHDKGVVHRDIKPENILINKKGQVKIADFGLAKLLGAAPDTSLTQSQAVMGTLNYMAPEQRENSKDVDHRADIYSLGVVFYEMLTGQVPMGRFEPPSKKVQIDVRLDEVVLKALEREPERRYQHASEVKTDVESFAEGRAGAQAEGQPQSPESEWPVVVAETGKILALSAVIGLAMWTLHTAWPLALLLLGSLTFDRTAGPQERQWVKFVWVISVIVLCGCGVWISKSAWPVVGLFLLFNWGQGDEEKGEEESEKDITSAGAGTPHQHVEAPPVAAPPATPIFSQPRLSRMALAGAVWASGFFPFALMSLFIVAVAPLADGTRPGTASQVVGLLIFRWGTATSPGTPWWQTVLLVTILFVGLTAPIGTTIAGYVSLSQIRHSAGQLYGLGLALFAALLFPLLIVDGVVVLFLAGMVGFSQNMAGFYGGVGSLLSVVADFFIVRKVWRSLK